MELSFARPHFSIVSFPTLELGKLTVIVGLNGSGKTTLLQALQNGSIRNSIVSESERSLGGAINFLQPKDTGFFADSYVSQIKNNGQMGDQGLGAAYMRFRDEELMTFRNQLDNVIGAPLVEALNGLDLWHSSPEALSRSLGCKHLDILTEVFSRAEELLMETQHPPQMGGRSITADKSSVFLAAQDVSKRVNIPMLKLRGEHINLFQHWGSAEPFRPNLALIFGSYRDKRLGNYLLRLADNANGTRYALSDDHFRQVLGEEPWHQVNKVLSAFGLPYEVCEPPEYEFGTVEVIFRSIYSGHLIKFDHLSSGEQVLARLAISTLLIQSDFLTIKKPKLLLMDEMDASLHPEMARRWLKGIENGLVAEQGIACILTTHSPTTVALAPEDALYEMIDGRSGLCKISKQAALNKLTFGVPTLSIDFTGRRQVFVESDTDAAVYDEIYKLIKPRLNLKKELNFLSTGVRKDSGEEQNTGCIVVKEIVNRLAYLGNGSVFGLIDWDGGDNVSTERIKVIAEGRRDGLENVIFDPLLICLLLMKDRKAPESVSDIAAFGRSASLDNKDLQRLADAIQIGLGLDISGPKKAVHYLGGAELQILQEYLCLDDHILEEKIRKTYDGLKRWRPQRGKLPLEIVRHVLYEHIDFCPIEIKNVFEEIANADV